MSIAVQVTKYKAKDGTLHDSVAAAEGHDAYKASQQLQHDVRDVIWEDVSNFCRERVPDWRDLEDWQQRDIEGQIADIFIDKFEQLAAIPALKRKVK